MKKNINEFQMYDGRGKISSVKLKKKKEKKNSSYYQKMYDQYGSMEDSAPAAVSSASASVSASESKLRKYDIQLDEYYRIRNEADAKKLLDESMDADIEEENPKMNTRSLFRENKMLSFQAGSFFLAIVILISGILFYNSKKTYERTDF